LQHFPVDSIFDFPDQNELVVELTYGFTEVIAKKPDQKLQPSLAYSVSSLCALPGGECWQTTFNEVMPSKTLVFQSSLKGTGFYILTIRLVLRSEFFSCCLK